MTNLENLFEQHFPKGVKYYPKSSKELIVYITEEEYLLSLKIKLFIDTWASYLYFGDNLDKMLIYQSTDLEELMRVTKDKLNKMFTGWVSKVN